MKYCSKCGNELSDEVLFCPRCGCNVSENIVSPKSEKEESVDIGLCVLSAFIPVFGVIYYFATRKNNKKAAEACGKISLIAWAVYFALGIILA